MCPLLSMFEKKIREGNCFGCDKPNSIVNRTKWLCNECNNSRLNSSKKEKEIVENKNCSKCNLDKPIVNNKYHLCNECNHYRLHNETTQQTLEKQFNKAQLKQQTKPKKKTTPTTQAKEETLIKQKLSQLKQDIETKALEEDTYHCKGCGCSYLGLDKSHILSVKQRKDLELEREY